MSTTISYPIHHSTGLVDPFRFFDFFDPMRDNRYFSDDVRQDETAFYIELATPGIPREQLSIEVLDGRITISYNDYKRTWRLDKGTDVSAIKADYKDGLLKVTVPKVVPPKPTPVQITIN